MGIPFSRGAVQDIYIYIYIYTKRALLSSFVGEGKGREGGGGSLRESSLTRENTTAHLRIADEARIRRARLLNASRAIFSLPLSLSLS